MTYQEAVDVLEILSNMRQDKNPAAWMVNKKYDVLWREIYDKFINLIAPYVPARINYLPNIILEFNKTNEKNKLNVYINGELVTDFNVLRNEGITLDGIASAILKNIQESNY